MQTVPTFRHAQRTHSLEVSEIVQLPDRAAKLSASGQDTVLFSNNTPVVLPCDMDDRFRLTVAKLDAAMTPRRRWIMLNAASNPTDALDPGEELPAGLDQLEAFIPQAPVADQKQPLAKGAAQ